MHNLASIFSDRIASGLKRKSVTTCSRWAMNYRVMSTPFPGPWTFKYHPWLREMHDSDSEVNVGMKGAQLGFTEAVSNIVFYNIDVKAVDVLYVLPNQTPDAADFSSGRFDQALQLSSHLSKMFSDVKNVGHKRAGSTNLYIRGSRSRSSLKSIPVGLLVMDEIDEFDKEAVQLGLMRTTGQLQCLIWALSTPSRPGKGIHALYLDSSQDHFMFRCPHCSRFTELVFPECLKITAEDINDPKINESHLLCKECKHKLDAENKHTYLSSGVWVSSYTDRAIHGWHVNQLYSSALGGQPVRLANAYLKSLRDPAAEQEFYNSRLGIPHIVKNAGVSDEDLNNCVGGYKSYLRYPTRQIITMGIDVGKWLHYEIVEWWIPGGTVTKDLNVLCECRVLRADKVKNFEELDHLLQDFTVRACVIDANPERRKALEFASRNHGRVKMCFYGMGVQGKSIHVANETAPEPSITVDRTSWLDLSLGRFKCQKIKLPIDISLEYREHIKSLVRVYDTDKHENATASYEKADNAEDHFAHTRNYSELALPFALSLGCSQDIPDEG